MTRGFTRLAQHGAEFQPHWFAGGEQRRAVAARQQSDQAIFGKGHTAKCACATSA
jgi:hypothetical protein